MTFFLSHSHADHAVVERICQYLAMNQIKVWKDSVKLSPGQPLTKGVLDAIRSAHYFCIVLSKESVRSEWVAMELEAALAHERNESDNFLLPVLIEACEIPAPLRDVVQIDLRSDFEAGMERLVRHVGRKYNVNLSGRLGDGLDYWFDWLIRIKNEDGRFALDLDMVAHDREATYSNVVHLRVAADHPVSLGDLDLRNELPATEHVLGLLIAHYSGKAGTLILVGNNAKQDRCVLAGQDGRETFTASLCVLRLGQVPKNVQLFPLREYLLQIRRVGGLGPNEQG